MPVIGERVSRAMADAATKSLHAMMGDLRELRTRVRAGGHSPHSRDIQQRSLSQTEAAEVWDHVRSAPVIWKPDDNCGPRAMMAAHWVNTRTGSGTTGIDDVLTMAVGVQPTAFRSIGHGYAYHAFPMADIDGVPHAFDPRMFDRPVPLPEMQAALGARVAIEKWSPIQNYGFEVPSYVKPLRQKSVPMYLGLYRDRLIDTWNTSARLGVVTDRPQTTHRA
jgi:hypothetical protein